MARKIQFRRGTAASWTSTDPTLAISELGLETDTGKIKIGDGVTAWSARPYIDAAALAHIADTSAAHAAASIASTPAGTLAATDVQAALNELDTEKAPLASPALTGTPTAPTAATATNTTQVATTAFVRANRAEQAAADISQYARQMPVGVSASPLNGRASRTAQAPRSVLHDKAWQALLLGQLNTRKAPYTTTLRYTASAGTSTQNMPDYASLTPGSGGNTTITADAGIVTAVTAVYNLTADPTRTTNRFSAFYRDTQQLGLTVGPTISDDIEVQCTVTPYQGLWAVQTPTAPTSLVLEVIDWDGTVFVTSNGTGGTTKSTLQIHDPIIPKLPLPTSGSVTNASYLCEAIQPSPNYSTRQTDPRAIGGTQSPSMWEGMPIIGYDTTNTNLMRFGVGARFYIFGTGTRGAAQTVPQVGGTTIALGGNTGSGVTKHLNVIHALVRVVDALYADRDAYPLGKVFLFVATRTLTGIGGQCGTVSGGTCAVDLYALPDSTYDYEGMVTL